ncbi:AraC family transcriptional regulator [Actinophytocola sediminis]
MPRDTRELAGAWTRYQRHASVRPSPDLADWVEKYWIVSWDYAEPYRQKMVPFPNVHLTFREGVAQVRGVSSGHRIEVLAGASGVFGVAFRPGCFRPLLDAPVATITDRAVAAAELFGPGLPDQLEVPAVEDYLRARLPDPDPRGLAAAEIVATIAADQRITRVDRLAADLGTSMRRLQRLFAEYVGIGPKWVIRRYRLREVTERLAAGTPTDLARLAADLGYADQAHFTRDFRDMFGEPPAWYAKRY